MPGDDVAGHGARCTTRAVTIQAPASHVWPWLTQPGYGRAGWYSYDWRGNGGQPGIGQIEPEWQQVGPRDPVRMMPGSAFDVVQVEDGHYFVVRAPDQTMSWCLDLEPLDQHSCRLISRWRAKWFVVPASAPWIALSGPGSFSTEHRMLLKIKARAETRCRLDSPNLEPQGGEPAHQAVKFVTTSGNGWPPSSRLLVPAARGYLRAGRRAASI